MSLKQKLAKAAKKQKASATTKPAEFLGQKSAKAKKVAAPKRPTGAGSNLMEPARTVARHG